MPVIRHILTQGAELMTTTLQQTQHPLMQHAHTTVRFPIETVASSALQQLTPSVGCMSFLSRVCAAPPTFSSDVLPNSLCIVASG
jgi:hypothetical protein